MAKKKEDNFLLNIIKYKNFKNNLLKPSNFKSEEDSIDYYHEQLDILLKMANRSLDTLLTEHSISQCPSEEANLAVLLLNYIEEIQGI